MTDTRLASPETAVRLSLFAIVGFMSVSEFTSGLIQSWYPPLVQPVGAALGVDAANLNWISAAYLLSSVIFVPVLAGLGDRYGHKRMVLFSLTMATIGTTVVAFAPNFGFLLLGRIITGALGALLPLELAIVRERGGSEAAKGIGILVAFLSVGSAVGMLISGLLGSILPLVLVLLLPAALSLLSLILIWLYVPETVRRTTGGIDWAGAAFLGISLALLVYALGNGTRTGWTHPLILGSLIAGVVLFGAFFLRERVAAHPLVDLSTLGRGGISFLLLLTFLFGVQFYGSGTVNSIFAGSKREELGYGFGLDTFGVGIILFLSPLFMGLSAGIAAKIAARLGNAAGLAIGMGLLTTKFTWVALMHDSLIMFALAQVVGGLGLGFFVALMPNLVVSRAEPNKSAVAGALYNSSRSISGAIAGAVFATIMAASFVPGTTVPSVQAFTTVWWICAAVCAAVLLLIPVARLNRPSPIALDFERTRP